MQPFAPIVGTEHVQPPSAPTFGGAKLEAVVRPGSAEEVAACLGAARSEGIPLIARGGGSKLHWGNPPDVSALVLLDLGRLNAAPELQPEEGIATAEAGVRVDALARAAAERGSCISLPNIFPEATVGGTIAADPPGPTHSVERQARNDLLGLEVALPTGELTRAGGKVVKNVTGFDLVRLYCGSLGTLGVITSATLRLRSLPRARRVLRRDSDELDAALSAATELMQTPLELAGVALEPGSEGWGLLWLLEGGETSVAEFAGRFVGDPASDEDWRAVGREIGEPQRVNGHARVRLGARPSDTRSLCQQLQRLAGARSLRVVLPRAGLVFADVPAEALPELWRETEARGWSLFLEHLPVELEYDVFGPEPDGLNVMRALKHRFDPDRVLAPGRYVGRI